MQYPSCCIEQFVEGTYQDKEKNRLTYNIEKFIPCDTHAEKMSLELDNCGEIEGTDLDIGSIQKAVFEKITGRADIGQRSYKDFIEADLKIAPLDKIPWDDLNNQRSPEQIFAFKVLAVERRDNISSGVVDFTKEPTHGLTCKRCPMPFGILSQM